MLAYIYVSLNFRQYSPVRRIINAHIDIRTTRDCAGGRVKAPFLVVSVICREWKRNIILRKVEYFSVQPPPLVTEARQPYDRALTNVQFMQGGTDILCQFVGEIEKHEACERAAVRKELGDIAMILGNIEGALGILATKENGKKPSTGRSCSARPSGISRTVWADQQHQSNVGGAGTLRPSKPGGMNVIHMPGI